MAGNELREKYCLLLETGFYQFGDKTWHEKVRTSAIANILVCEVRIGTLRATLRQKPSKNSRASVLGSPFKGLVMEVKKLNIEQIML